MWTWQIVSAAAYAECQGCRLFRVMLDVQQRTPSCCSTHQSSRKLQMLNRLLNEQTGNLSRTEGQVDLSTHDIR